MWDNTPLLRNIANALIAFSLFAVSYGAVYYTTHLPWLFPLRSVRLDEVPQRVTAAEVLQIVRDEVNGNFFTLDIERLRESLEKLPWVSRVSIRREFPDRLRLRLEEHQVLAHWNNSELVDQQGKIFSASIEQPLPSFTGQDGASAEVAQQFVEFNQQLATLNLHVEQIDLSPRHSWQLRLDNGMALELGRENMQERLTRFVEAYPYSLARQNNNDRRQRTRNAAVYVDLRYHTGFAVKQITNDKG